MTRSDNTESGASASGPQYSEHTQIFAPHPYPPGPTGHPGDTWWSAEPARPSARRSTGRQAIVAAVLAVAVAVPTTLITSAITDDPPTATELLPVNAQQSDIAAAEGTDTGNTDTGNTDTGNTAGEDAVAESGGGGSEPAVQPAGAIGDGDLREGAVFVQSNDIAGNEVVAFARSGDGTLSEVGRFPTGGTGTGSFEDSAQGIVLGTADGEAAPIQHIDRADLLFVTNAGSGTITVFRVKADRLELVTETPSGGNRPVSLTVNNGLLYVLNSGEVDRRLLLGPNSALENCGHGELPSVTGFRVSGDGALEQIIGSKRLLSGQGESGCAQVSFTENGKTLVVTERIANGLGGTEDGEGVIVTFDVREDGTLGNKRLIDPTGVGPFGFTFTADGVLLTSEQNRGFYNPGGGAAAAYQFGAGSSLRPVGESIPNMQTDSCWIVVTDNQRFAFVSSPFGGGRISSYKVGDDGSLTLANPVATAPDGKDASNDAVPDGITDLSLSRDSKYLYQLNSFEGTLWVFLVNGNGTLTYIENHRVFNLEPFGMGGEAAPFGISAF